MDSSTTRHTRLLLPASLADIVLLFSTEDTKPVLDLPLDSKSHLRMWTKSRRSYRLGYWKIRYQEDSRSNIYGIRSFDHIRSYEDLIELSEADTYLNGFGAFFGLQGSLESYFRRRIDQRYTKEPRIARTPSSTTHNLLATHCCAETPTCSHYPYRRAPCLSTAAFHTQFCDLHAYTPVRGLYLHFNSDLDI